LLEAEFRGKDMPVTVAVDVNGNAVHKPARKNGKKLPVGQSAQSKP
jgi:LDH2 family malate/lactate/ureidoglycolate dehydrogenase